MGITSGDHAEHQRAILRRPRERTYRVERRAHRKDAVLAHPAICRLQPDYAVHRGRDANRTTRVGADRAKGGTHGDRYPRPRAGSSRVTVDVPRIAGWWDVLPICELVC